MKDRSMGFKEIAVAGDALQLAPGLAARMPIRADVAMSEPAIIGAIVIRTEMLSSVDGAPAYSGEGAHRRGAPGALGGASVPCSHASQSGLWSSSVKGLGYLVNSMFMRRGAPWEHESSVEHLPRGLSDLRNILEVALRLSGHPIWLLKKIKMRAATRSWYKNRFGGMMTSPLTLV